MLACERERGFIMVEGDLFPVCCGVAEFALRSEPAIMFIILLMATDAGGVDLQTALGMTGFAGQGAMFAIQKEVGLIMGESDLLPVLGGVAELTLQAQIALMLVVLAMAGGTVGLDIEDLSIEDKRGAVMTEGVFFPTGCGMTTVTRGAILSLMFVILGVTTDARCILSGIKVIGMAGFAFGLLMFAL